MPGGNVQTYAPGVRSIVNVVILSGGAVWMVARDVLCELQWNLESSNLFQWCCDLQCVSGVVVVGVWGVGLLA